MDQKTPLPDTFYKEIASYYDDDARDFERRYNENPVLKKIRNEFRAITRQAAFTRALEIGCGPGLDVCYFAREFPNREFFALDISPNMIRLARQNAESQRIPNIHFAVGSAEDVPDRFPDIQFDLVYVFFGALNTVHDLQVAASCIREYCADQSTVVVTFVNRYYLFEIPLWLAKGRWDKAFERVNARWQGYSDEKKISSRVYSASDVARAFGPFFNITSKRGFSLFYPAWYRSHLLQVLGRFADVLWNVDHFMAKTPFWNTGEYSLYVMRPAEKG